MSDVVAVRAVAAFALRGRLQPDSLLLKGRDPTLNPPPVFNLNLGRVYVGVA